jgi:hypothetical protein
MSYKLSTYNLSMYRPNMYKLGYRVQMGYHEPHSPPWVIAYWVFILEYSWNIWTNFFEKSFKILKIFITLLCYGLHQKFVRNMSCQKNTSPFTI